MIFKYSFYILFTIVLSSCSTSKIPDKSKSVVNVVTSTKLDCKKIQSNTRKSLLRFCSNLQNVCSSSDARSSALHRLWKVYGKKDIHTPYKVISENEVWIITGFRNSAPSKIVNVIIPKNSKTCAIKEISHKQRIYDLQ